MIGAERVAPDIAAILNEARREIANAKLAELCFQSRRIGTMVRAGFIAPAEAADALYEAAVANGLVIEHGAEAIQDILAISFRGVS